MFHGKDGYQPFPADAVPYARSEIQIAFGRRFNPLEPIGPDNDLDEVLIGHALSLTNRWNGFTSFTDGSPLAYTVAQHAVHVADLTQMARRDLVPGWDWENSPSPAMWGLHHDDPEAIIADIVRPIKPNLSNYAEFENRIERGIINRFDIPINAGILEAVRRVDNLMIFLERDALMGRPERPYGNERDHPRFTIFDAIPEFCIWSPAEAKERYIAKHREIVAHDGNHVPLQYKNRGFGLRSLKLKDAA
jgi:hypothetical protein